MEKLPHVYKHGFLFSTFACGHFYFFFMNQYFFWRGAYFPFKLLPFGSLPSDLCLCCRLEGLLCRDFLKMSHTAKEQ